MGNRLIVFNAGLWYQEHQKTSVSYGKNPVKQYSILYFAYSGLLDILEESKELISIFCLSRRWLCRRAVSTTCFHYHAMVLDRERCPPLPLAPPLITHLR